MGLRNVFYIALFVSLISCDKENAPDCFQRTGDNTTETVLISESFESIELFDNISVSLENTLPGEAASYELTGPENLLSDIELEVKNQVLTITNENTCNWVRPYDEFHLTIKNNEIKRIFNYGSVGVNLLNYESEKFTFEQESSVADNHIHFNGENLTINLHTGAGSAQVSGDTQNLNLYANGLGEINALEMNCPSISVNNSGRRDIYTNPSDYMFVTIKGSGSVFYTNLQINLLSDITGSGELIYIEN